MINTEIEDWQTPVGKEEYRLVCGFSNGDLWPAPALWKAYLPTTFLSPSSKRPFVLEIFPVHGNTHSLTKLRDNCMGITFAWSLTNEVAVWKGSNSWSLKKPGQLSPEERWSQPMLTSSHHCFPQSNVFDRNLRPANRVFLEWNVTTSLRIVG